MSTASDPVAWSNPQVFQWRTSGSAKNPFRILIAMLLSIAVAPAILLLVLGLLTFVSKTAAYWSGFVLLGGLVITSIHAAARSFSKSPAARIRARRIFFYGSLALLAALLFLLHSPLCGVDESFRYGEQAGIGDWGLYLVDNVLSVVLLDVPEVYDLRTSRVAVQFTVSRVLTVLVRLLIVFGMLQLIVDLIRSRLQKRAFYGTVQDAYWECKALPDPKHVHVELSGDMVPLPFPQTLHLETMLSLLKERLDEEQQPEGSKANRGRPVRQPWQETKVVDLKSAQKLTDSEVLRGLDWTDPTTYAWTGRIGTADAYQRTIHAFVTNLLLAPVFFGGFALIGWVLPAVAYWLAFGLGAVSIVAVVVSYVRTWTRTESTRRFQARFTRESFSYLGLGCLLYVLYSPCSHYSSGFVNGTSAGFWEWLLFYFDNVAKVVLLDVLELFNVNFSIVRYDSDVARGLTVGIRVLITLSLLESVLEEYGLGGKNKTTYATIKELYYRFTESMADKMHFVRCEAYLVAREPAEQFNARAFLSRFNSEAE